MNSPIDGPKAAFQASVHGIRTVGGRKVIQVVLEAPIEFQSEIARICEHDAWVAVARIQKPTETAKPDKRRWIDLAPAQQAGILCSDPEFWEYLGVTSEEEAAISVRAECKVDSRRSIKGADAQKAWDNTVNNFRIWQQAKA